MRLELEIALEDKNILGHIKTKNAVIRHRDFDSAVYDFSRISKLFFNIGEFDDLPLLFPGKVQLTTAKKNRVSTNFRIPIVSKDDFPFGCDIHMVSLPS